MIDELTSNPDCTTLTETTVMGRTVYVSKQSKEAYVPFQDELVSMTNLRAWNALIEDAKKDVIDDYTAEKTLAEKEFERKQNRRVREIEDMARQLHRFADDLRSVDGGDGKS